jgi:hypothetical protein
MKGSDFLRLLKKGWLSTRKNEEKQANLTRE